MGVGILGVEETYREGVGSFSAQLPECEGGDEYIVFYSGERTNCRGVGMIVKKEIEKYMMMWEPISERNMIMKLKMAPVNLLIVQIYAPCETEKDEEKEKFYERVDQVIKEHRKGRECLVVMGDFNGKVAENRRYNETFRGRGEE